MTTVPTPQADPVAEFIGGSLTAKLARNTLMFDKHNNITVRFPVGTLDRMGGKVAPDLNLNWLKRSAVLGGYFAAGMFSTIAIGATFVASLGATLAYPGMTGLNALGVISSVNAATLAFAQTVTLVLGSAMLAGGCARMFGAPVLRALQGKPKSSLSPCARFCAGAIDAVTLPTVSACAITGTLVGSVAAVGGSRRHGSRRGYWRNRRRSKRMQPYCCRRL
jgi:hypothetical protein